MADDDTTTLDDDAPERELEPAASAAAPPRPAGQQRPAAKADDGDDGAELREAGKRALDEERKARRAAEAQLKKHAAELEQLKQASMSETERAIAQARAEARRETLAAATERLVRAEVRAAAAGKLADPGDAAYLLGDLSGFADDDGEVDSKAISKAIDELVKAKPYLTPQGSKPAPLPGGGATPSNGFDMDSWLRREARSKGR